MKPLTASHAFLIQAGFTRTKLRFDGQWAWRRGTSTIFGDKPTPKDVVSAIYGDAHNVGYAKAQADMQAAAKAFLGPLGLLPDVRVQQMRELPSQP